MSNIFDYLNWRGDITFGNAPLCPADALILSVLPYIRLEGFVPSSPTAEPVRLADAAKAYLAQPLADDVIDQNHNRLLARLCDTPRFANLRLVAARKSIDRALGMQFAAITVLLPGQSLFLAFEGTDNTLVGWQEDFRMSYECPVPAQLRAAAYFKEVARAHPLRRAFLGGHSKGGTLAMYAAVHGGEELYHRIRAVYNNDGPGFCDDTLASPGYRTLRPRIHTFLPQSSIVAVLLEHDENYRIVKSDAKGILQHDVYSWQVMGNDFEYATERTAFGRRTEEIVDRFVKGMSPERLKRFGEALFTLLEGTNYDTVSAIGSNRLQSAKAILRGYTELDAELRDVVLEAVAALNRSRREVKRDERERSAALKKQEKSS